MNETKTSEFFDSYAEDFNEIYGNENTFINNLINRIFRKSMMIRFKKTIEGCKPIKGKSVIDIGCGPGLYSIILAERGAEKVLGVDFAENMIKIAKEKAKREGVTPKTSFVEADFFDYEIKRKYDYAVVMGLMDYIEKQEEFVDKVLSNINKKAFFSFPVKKGFLAWQRKLRYKKRCDLYLYTEKDIKELFKNFDFESIDIEKISRDYFVTVKK